MPRFVTEAMPMSRIHVVTLALWSLAALASSAAAQVLPAGVPGRGNEGQIFGEGDDVQVCQTSGGGTRSRANCEQGTTTVRTEQELRISIKRPPLPGAKCDAVSSTSYHQRNTVARVETTIQAETCAALTGAYTVALRIGDESATIQTLEFPVTFQRSDDKAVSLTADYPIGENVELVSARVRGLSCTCADAPRDPASESAAVSPTLP
jgi:hypothetical protein